MDPSSAKPDKYYANANANGILNENMCVYLHLVSCANRSI